MFNKERDPGFFREDEVDYMIHLLRYSAKDFTSLDLIKPPFNKGFATLDKLMNELQVPHLFDKVAQAIYDITPANTMKVLVRAKIMFQYRA